MENILITKGSADYELLDCGHGEKLERYGTAVLSRPDPQALWPKALSKEEWMKANAVYTRTGTAGKWEIKEAIAEPWKVSIDDQVFSLKLLPSKHLGLFPEQSEQWKWIGDKIKKEVSSGRTVSVLNMFAYTGGATMASAKAGASVVHLDASKFTVDFANQNLKNSGLQEKPVRFIVDDVRKFVEREIKRGNKYDVIIMDPPVYGKGANDEVWKIEEDLMPLMLRLKQIISQEPVAFILNGYSSGYSHLTYAEMLKEIMGDFKGSIVSGELAIKESSKGRLLTTGIFARFEN